MELSLTISSQFDVTRSTPNDALTSAVSTPGATAIAASSTLPNRRMASACTLPMNPEPIIAVLSFFILQFLSDGTETQCIALGRPKACAAHPKQMRQFLFKIRSGGTRCASACGLDTAHEFTTNTERTGGSPW